MKPLEKIVTNKKLLVVLLLCLGPVALVLLTAYYLVHRTKALPFNFSSTRLALLLSAGLGLFVTSAVLTYAYFAQNPATDTVPSLAQQAQTPDLDLGEPPDELTELSILLLGYGGPGHSGGFLTDVIQVVHVNFEKSTVALISIPRDLWVTLPNGKQSKINAAFTLGDDPNQKVASGGQVAKEMASIVTGLPIHYVISTDFVSFKRIVGYVLEGITVDVPETLDDPWYPIAGEEQNPCGKTPEEIAQLTNTLSGFELEKQFECRYEHIHFDAGPVEMEGHEALAYVRSRHGSGAGDFSRSQRQHALLKAVRDRLFSQEALSDVPQFFGELVEHTTSDIDLEIAKYLAPAIQQAKDFEAKSVVISTDNVLVSGKSGTGQYILMPQAGLDEWTEVRAFVAAEL